MSWQAARWFWHTKVLHRVTWAKLDHIDNMHKYFEE